MGSAQSFLLLSSERLNKSACVHGESRAGVWCLAGKDKMEGLSSHQAASQCLYLWHFWILGKKKKHQQRHGKKKGHFLYPITIMGNLCSDVTSTEKSGDFLIMRRKQTRHDYINVLSGLWTHCRGSFYFWKTNQSSCPPPFKLLAFSHSYSFRRVKPSRHERLTSALPCSTDVWKYIFGEGSFNSLVMYSNALICPPVQQSQLRTYPGSGWTRSLNTDRAAPKPQLKGKEKEKGLVFFFSYWSFLTSFYM